MDPTPLPKEAKKNSIKRTGFCHFENKLPHVLSDPLSSFLFSPLFRRGWNYAVVGAKSIFSFVCASARSIYPPAKRLELKLFFLSGRRFD
jgi:hypothetical protein